VPQRLHDITVPNSDHFQHVGQQTFMTTSYSQQGRDGRPMASLDSAEIVTGSAQTGQPLVDCGSIRRAGSGARVPGCSGDLVKARSAWLALSRAVTRTHAGGTEPASVAVVGPQM
jgi:hypothetical protein